MVNEQIVKTILTDKNKGSFLEINGIKIDASNEEITELGLAVASGSCDSDTILKWIEAHKK